MAPLKTDAARQRTKDVERDGQNADGSDAEETDAEGLVERGEGIKREKKGKKDKKEKKEIEIPDDGVPYDRGWAWMVVLAGFINFVIISGYNKSTSIFFVNFLEEFRAPVTETALVFGVKAGVNSVVGLFVMNAVVGRFGVRKTVMVGGLCLSLSAILGSQATDVTTLVLGQAVFHGLGMSMLAGPATVLLGFYFRRRRSVAMSVTKCGVGAGSVAFPPLVTALLQHYGLRGALMIMAAVCLNTLVVAALLRPVSFYRKPHKAAMLLQVEKSALKPLLLQNEDRDMCSSRDEKTQHRDRYSSRDETMQPSSGQGAMIPLLQHSDGPRTLDSEKRQNAFQKQSGYDDEKATQYTYYDDKATRNSDYDEEARKDTEYDDKETQRIEYDKNEATQHSEKKPQQTDYDDKAMRQNGTAVGQNNTTRQRDYNNDQLTPTEREQSALRNSHTGVDTRSDAIGTPWREDDEKTNPAEKVRLVRTGQPRDAGQSGLIETDHNTANGVSPTTSSSAPVETDHNTGNSVTPTTATRAPETTTSCVQTPCGPCTCSSRNVLGVLDFSLFHSPMFRLLVVFFALSPTLGAVTTYMPVMAKERGLDEDQRALLLSITGGLDFCSRLLVGFLADTKIMKVSSMIAVAFTMMGAVCQLTRLLTSFSLLVVLAVAQGMLGGVSACLMPILIMEDVGLDHTAKAMGFMKLFSGAAMAAFHPLLGFIRDSTGSYDAAYNVIGATTLASAGVIACLRFLPHRLPDPASGDQEVVVVVAGQEDPHDAPPPPPHSPNEEKR